jgi:hypothetical protein
VGDFPGASLVSTVGLPPVATPCPLPTMRTGKGLVIAPGEVTIVALVSVR